MDTLSRNQEAKMMQRRKKVLAVLLAAALLITIGGPAVYAQDEPVTSLNAGYNYSSGVLTVTGSTDALAVAVSLYGTDTTTLLRLISCGVTPEGDFSAVISGLSLAAGTYTVKAADYEGGPYATATFRVTVPSGSSGGQGSAPSQTGITVSAPNPNEPEAPTTVVMEFPAELTPNGTADVSLTENTIAEAIRLAGETANREGKADNGISVAVKVTGTGSSGNITVNLPPAVQNNLLDAQVKELRIVSENMEIGFDEEALRQIRNTAGTDVSINIAQADRSALSAEAQNLIGSRPVYQVQVSYSKNGQTAFVSQFGEGSASLNIPYSPEANETIAHLFAFYIDDQGKAVRVPGSYYDPERGGVVLSTGHFSIYGIGYQTPVIKGDFKRIAGEDRIQTALKISRQGWPEGAATVVLARGDDFPDALAGVPLAKRLDAPVLLTGKAALAEGVEKEIQRLKAETVYILGGTGAISREIQDRLTAQGYTVIRLGGANRWETAALIAKELNTKGQAVLVNGYDFPDALGISAWAAANSVPLLLTAKDQLPSVTGEALQELAVTETIVSGGMGVVSDRVAGALPGVIRYAGENRYGTNQAVLERLAKAPSGNLKLSLATGRSFPDALTGAVLAAKDGGHIFFVDQDLPEPLIREFLLKYKDAIEIRYIFGGTGAVSEETVDRIRFIE